MSRKLNILRGVITAVVALTIFSCSSSRPAETKVAPASYPAPGSTPRVTSPIRTRAAMSRTRAPSKLAYVDAHMERRAHMLANRARREEGLSPLSMRLDLIDLARKHALDMARRDYFAHHSPEGIGPGDRATMSGVDFQVFAENLARIRHGARPAELAVEGWLGSPGHRRNLLDEGDAGYRFTGVGAARTSDGTVLISQVFLR